MVNKKRIISYSFISLFALSSILAVGKYSFSSIARGVDAEEWVHYKRREATSTSNGIREYWVKCGGEYRFTAPSSSNIKDATSYDLSGFTDNDPRYIKYISDSKAVFYNLTTSSYNCAELPELSGYSTINVSKVAGNISRVEFQKNNSSPYYNALCYTVTDTIGSKDDLSALQSKIAAGIVDGHYVLTNDLSNPSTNVPSSSDTIGVFKGTLDGRNHIITNPVFWGHRMLGRIVDATIKNIAFKDISVFSVLCVMANNSLIENVNFYTADTIHTWSNVGMVADIFAGSTQMKNCYIDFKDHYHLYPGGAHKTAPIASVNQTNQDNTTFVNVTVKCLSDVNMFLQDYYGRNLRPTSINYISSYYFLKDGVLNYDIKYRDNDNDAKIAANFIKKTIESITGKTMSISYFSELTKFDRNTPSIILGSDASLEDNYLTVPQEEGGYIVKSIGKAIYINTYDQYGWQTAALKFLEKAFGYDNIGGGIAINTVADKTTIDLMNVNLEGKSLFRYRRADPGDAQQSNYYADGCNILGWTSNDIFIPVSGHSDDKHMSSSESFHTLLRILYPGTYESTHSKWYATNSKGNIFDKYDDSYYTYQLCYTAHGDSAEYTAMVNEAANNIINEIAKDTNPLRTDICLGIGDSANYCNCSYCSAKTSEYGAISGTLINFLNDVSDIIYARLSETGKTKLTISTFAYQSYKEAPVNSAGEATIVAKNGINIMLAPIEANYTKPINDATSNPSSSKMFEQWSKVCGLYSWLYNTNFSHYLYPYNSFSAMCESISYMATKNVKLAYIEGQHNVTGARTGFNALKEYLEGKYMIGTEHTYEGLVNRFFNNYYGAGSSEMRTFFNEMVSRMETFDTNTLYKYYYYKNNTLRSIYGDVDNKNLWSKSQLEQWVSLCTTAYNKATSAATKKHILAESIFPRFALCTAFESSFSSSELLTMRQSFKVDAETLGIKYTGENQSANTLEQLYSQWGV